MGFIKAGFTGGFIGIVIGVGAIFTRYEILNKLSSLGFLLAKYFGKVCTDTEIDTCTLSERFTTVLATIVGNCIAYFILGVLISLGISLVKIWLSGEKTEKPLVIETQPEQKVQAEPIASKVSKEPKRPETKAIISRKNKIKNIP